MKLENVDLHVLLDGTGKVCELEDKEYASQIEVLFTDVQILAKYRENLVNLKWVHTGANGKLRKKKMFHCDI